MKELGRISRTSKRRSRGNDRFTYRNRVQLVQAGKEFFTFLEQLIDSAEYSIHFQTYIFEKDSTGEFIADALKRAARRDVKVYLLVDGFASQNLSGEFKEELEKEGIRFRFFEPWFRSPNFYFGRRLHHKVVVVDGARALVGSMNIADKYNDVPPEKAWFDVALSTEGEAAAELYQVCCRMWTKRARNFEIPEIGLKIIESIPKTDHCAVRISRNDWLKRYNDATRSYIEMVRNAEKEVTIICSYFLPNEKLMLRLAAARRRGVKIRIILAGVTDVKTAKFAERYLYRWMLRHEMMVYEYQPTVLHAKFAVADDALLTLGSYNVNSLSDYASIELNLDVKEPGFVKEVRKKIDRIVKNDCNEVDAAVYKRILSPRQFLQWSAFQFLRVMVKLVSVRSRSKG